jgi:hypothetical protein
MIFSVWNHDDSLASGMPAQMEMTSVPSRNGGSAATAWSLKINDKKRHRVYCYMPVMDSVPVAPETYVRKFKSWCAKHPFLKKIFN